MTTVSKICSSLWHFNSRKNTFRLGCLIVSTPAAVIFFFCEVLARSIRYELYRFLKRNLKREQFPFNVDQRSITRLCQDHIQSTQGVFEIAGPNVYLTRPSREVIACFRRRFLGIRRTRV